MERERERNREEEWRREREMERMRDKTRHRGKDVEPRERYPERDRPPAPRGREGERELRDRERRREAERRQNGRPLSNLETVADRLLERVAGKKGDTFPRMRKHSKERDRRMDTFTERDAERGGTRTTGRQRRPEVDDRERDRERAPRRERQGDEERHRERERDAAWERNGGRPAGGEGTGRSRERERRRERDSEGNDLWSRRGKHAGERERPRLGSREREGRMPSPRTSGGRDDYPDRESRDKAEGRDGRRDTRSEGDSDGQGRRERVEDRDREELRFRHCRSEGDNGGKAARETDGERRRYAEEERQRDRERGADRARVRDEGRERGAERDADRHRDVARRKEREGERQRDDGRHDDRQRHRDRREGDRHRERKEEDRRHRDRRDRDAESRREEAAGGRGSRPPGDEMPPRPPPRAQSSGEWSSDLDSDRRQRRVRDGHEEREHRREGTADGERERGVEEERGPREHRSRGRADREREEDRKAGRAQHRRMWLEPPGMHKKELSLEDERERERKGGGGGGGGEREGEGRREREEHEVEGSHLDRRRPHGGHYDSERDTERGGGGERWWETEGVSVDGEEASEARGEGDLPSGHGGSAGGRGPRDGEGERERERENVTGNTEESDREEEGGSDSFSHSGSEGGSERGWGRERDRMPSGEDGFVTGSSDWDDGRDEEDFEDCRESWDGGVAHGRGVGSKGREGEKDGEEESTGGKEDGVEEEGEEGAEGHGAEKRPKYIFCVIGQTLPRSNLNQESELDPMERQRTDNPNSGSSRHGSDDITHPAQNELQPVPGRDDECNTNNNQETKRKGDELSHTDETFGMDVRCRISPQERKTGEEEKSKVEHPYAEIGPINRDSETEKLLTEWRERNKQAESEREWGLVSPINPYGEVGSRGTFSPIQSSPDANNPRTMTPEEEVAIRIRMSGAWSMAEEAKRRSQAPHMKWAKNVMREILGSSEDYGGDQPQVVSLGGQEVNPLERATAAVEEEEEEGVVEEKEEEVAAHSGELPVYATVQKTREAHDRSSEAELDEVEEMEPLEMEEQRDDEDGRSESWGEVDLRNVLDTMGRRKRNSKFFNAAQLYQQYSEAAQNSEILRQARSDVVSISEDPPGHFPAPVPSSPSSSPPPSPPPARRPLPPLPAVPHPHSLSHAGSVSSCNVQNLPVPEPPREASSPRLSISLGQSATLWQDLPGVRNSTELDELTGDQRRLQEVRFEVVTSEASYCRSLDIVVEHFVKSKQLGSLLTTQDRNWLFSRLADVRAISHSFLSKLEERVESDTMRFAVCDIIARHCQRFKMVYVPYLTNQSYQDATYQRLMEENQGFKRVVDKLERSPVCQRLPLRSFLILPFQRITRIKLLVQNIVKRTAPGTEEVVQAIKALRLLEKLIQESNDSITQMKSIESLVSLSAKVDFECRTLPLISQSRRLVREGPVTELMDFSLKETERSVFFHLFNDYLLISLHKEGGRFTVIDHAPVSDLRAENCRVKLHSLQKNLFRLHLSSRALLLRTDNQGDKLRWISAVSRPHPPIDFSAAQDFTQMQCIRAFVAQQPDELSLEKADIILVHQKSGDRWVEGTRLADRHRGWMPESHLETITNSRVRQRNLSDALKLNTATAAV